MDGNNKFKINYIMKRLVIPFLVITLLAFTTCEDNRLKDMADDKVYLIFPRIEGDPEMLLRADVFDFGEQYYVFNVPVYKSGYGTKDGHVSLEVDRVFLGSFNNRNSTLFDMLPSALYRISTANTVIPKDETRGYIPIEFNIPELAKINLSDLAIPVKLVAKNDIEVSDGRQFALLAPTLKMPYIRFDRHGLVPPIYVTLSDPERVTYLFPVSVNYPNQWDLTYRITVDAEAVERYNQENDTEFMLLPEGAYELYPDEWTLAARSNNKDISYTIFKDAIVNEDGRFVYGDYILPLQISEVSQWGIDPQEGLALINVNFMPAALLKHGWEVIDWNSSITLGPDYVNELGTPDKIIDMDPPGTAIHHTWWSSNWEPPWIPMPYHITVDMKAPKTILQVQLKFPCQPGEGYRGNVKAGYFEVSDDNETWTKLEDFERPDNSESTDCLAPSRLVVVNVPETVARYIKVVITEAHTYHFEHEDGRLSARMNIQELEVIGFD